MATLFWPRTTDGELIELEFITLEGDWRKLKLLVDTGFTGKSSFALPEDSIDLVRADYRPTHAVGAIQGPQNRRWVTCWFPPISFRQMLIAIVADTSPLSLPVGIGVQQAEVVPLFFE